MRRWQVHNGEVLQTALERSLRSRSPLVTVSNHHCCLDDPFLFGATLSWRHLFDKELMRWSLAAHDVCFTRATSASLFSLGKIVPVVRGLGVHQPGVDFCSRRLLEGAWIHVFPEGRVNLSKAPMRLKWGVGRLLADCPLRVTLLPIFHLGLDDVLPNKTPYLPRIGKRVTVCFGQPVEHLQVSSQSWQTGRLRLVEHALSIATTTTIGAGFFWRREDEEEGHHRRDTRSDEETGGYDEASPLPSAV